MEKPDGSALDWAAFMPFGPRLNRAGRSRFFNSTMFGEAAWDMLLALYVTEASVARHILSINSSSSDISVSGI